MWKNFCAIKNIYKILNFLTELIYNINWVRKVVITTQELYLKYKDYKAPHIKIQTELKNKNLFLIKR